MKVNPMVPWGRHYENTKILIHQLPFLLVGGSKRASEWLADKLIVTKLTLPFPNLPKAFDGLTITHLTDLHIGPLFSLNVHLPHVIRVCQELNSDLICCTGDWVDYKIDQFSAALKELEQCRPPLGWFGVLGNHDYHFNRWLLLDILRPWLKERLLINQFLPLNIGSDSIDVCGLDFSVGGPRLQRGLESIRLKRQDPAPFTLGLAHYPDNFDAFRRAHRVDLLLSGHTHGGQISWTRAPKPACGPATGRFKYCRGLYEEEGAVLYVGCGLGASIPIRINCPPEITQFKLVRGKPGGIVNLKNGSSFD